MSFGLLKKKLDIFLTYLIYYLLLNFNPEIRILIIAEIFKGVAKNISCSTVKIHKEKQFHNEQLLCYFDNQILSIYVVALSFILFLILLVLLFSIIINGEGHLTLLQILNKLLLNMNLKWYKNTIPQNVKRNLR